MSGIRAWQEEKRKQVFKKYSRGIDEVTFKLPDGSIEKYYLKSEGATTSILGITSDKLVILVRQFRPGPKRILHELPGGFIDANETPIKTARREFIEETGYDGDFELAGTCIDDAYSNVVRHCFVAKNCKLIGVPQNTSSEKTEVVLKSIGAFRNQLRSGMLTDTEMGYIGLDYLGLL